MIFFHDNISYPIIQCIVQHNEGFPCIFRVQIHGEISFSSGNGILFLKDSIFAQGVCVHIVRQKNITECIYRCARNFKNGLFYWDRVTGLCEETSLFKGKNCFHLNVLDEKITIESLPVWCGVHLESQAKWIYEDEVIFNASSFFSKDLPFPKVGTKIPGGYEVCESKSPKTLKIYGYSRYYHEEVLHLKMHYQKEGSWLRVPYPVFVDNFEKSFFRSNPQALKTLFNESLSYMKAMHREKIIEAQFIFEESIHITLQDLVTCTLPSLGIVTGKVIGYKLSCHHSHYVLKLRFALSKERRELPSFSPPSFSKLKETEWIEGYGENFLKLRQLKGRSFEELHWDVPFS